VTTASPPPSKTGDGAPTTLCRVCVYGGGIPKRLLLLLLLVVSALSFTF
jgi:hypothetical protein